MPVVYLKKENSYLTVKSYRKYATPASPEHMVFVEFLYSVGFFFLLRKEEKITEEEKYKKRKNLRNLLIKLFGMIFKRTRVLNLFY